VQPVGDVLRNVFQPDRGKCRTQKIFGCNQALVEHRDQAGHGHLVQDVGGFVEIVLASRARERPAVGELMDLNVADLMRSGIQQMFHKFAGTLAECLGLAQVGVIGVQAGQRVPQETAIEQYHVRNVGLRIPQVMARDSRNVGMRRQEFRQV